MLTAEILSTGDEIRSGALIDSNSAYIAQKLEEQGIFVTRHNSVGDNMDQLVAVLKEIGQRSSFALVTGGLGPTTDDLTAQAAAKAGGVELALDEAALASVENWFKRYNFSMSTSNKKQAYLPQGSQCIKNPVGTAPGFQMKIENGLFFFMPGVPFEMKRMLKDSVIPQIKTLSGNENQVSKVKTLCSFGLAESVVNDHLLDFPQHFPDLTLGMRAKFPEIQVKVYGLSQDQDQLEKEMCKALEWVNDKLGQRVFSLNGESMEQVVGRLLLENKATLAVAESCTGGLISSWLTNVAGSSDYFKFGAVTYANEAKIGILGVLPETIETYGAVSVETVKEMAAQVRKSANTTYGIATSGIAGPSGGSDEKPVGTLCVGIATESDVFGRRFDFPFRDRLRNKTLFAMTGLEMLRRKLVGLDLSE